MALLRKETCNLFLILKCKMEERTERARTRARERERKKGEILQLSRPLPLCNATRETVQRGCTRETERLRERKGD